MNELDNYLYNLDLLECKDSYNFEELDVSEFLNYQEKLDNCDED
jgi:hypothetical protein